MKKFASVLSIVVAVVALLAVGVMLLPSPSAYATSPGGLSLVQVGALGSDPCQNPSVLKQSASVTISSATTTAIVTAVAGDYITVCNWQLNAVGTTPTIQFEYGTATSTACDTGATALTGAVPVATTTTYLPAPNDELKLRVGVISQELCIVSGGTLTTNAIQGSVVYVQQPY
jgi:hypothetical protein